MAHLNIAEIGIAGEREIAMILKANGIDHIRKPDFCVFIKNKWFAVEVKNKEPWEPYSGSRPIYAQGMPRSQYLKDLNMTHLGMPCILTVRGKNHEWLGQELIKLKEIPDPRWHIIAKDDIVWFNLEQFKLFNQILQELKS